MDNEQNIVLQLGDIIKVYSQTLQQINNQIFLIDYIDGNLLKIINSVTLDIFNLQIENESIAHVDEIELIKRNENNGYVKQHDLHVNDQVRIHFEDINDLDVDAKIIEIEEDMIGLMLENGNVIYINFAYKGIPQDLGIDHIEKMETMPEEEEMVAMPEEEEEMVAMPEKEEEMVAIPEQRPEQIKQLTDFDKLLIEADNISFGNMLGSVTEVVNVDARHKRYGIDDQVDDLLTVLLSTIPNFKRTQSVMLKVKSSLNMYKILRSEFSNMNENGEITGFKLNTSRAKPLAEYLSKLSNKLYWVKMGGKATVKLYKSKDAVDYFDDDENATYNIDYSGFSDLKRIFDNRSDTNNTDTHYNTFLSNIDKQQSPTIPIVSENIDQTIIAHKLTNGDTSVILNNDSVYGTNSKDINFSFVNENILQNELITVNSILFLPEPVIRFSKINLPNTSMLSKANINAGGFINYSSILNKKTINNFKNIRIDNMEEEIQYDASRTTNYSIDIDDGIKPSMNNIMDLIVPQPKVLFKLMKKYMTNALSLVRVVNQLEPFMFYCNNLTYNQWNIINQFIYKNIKSHMAYYGNRKQIFSQMKVIKHFKPRTDLLDLKTKQIFSDDLYFLKNKPSELLYEIITRDNGELFNLRCAESQVKFEKNIILSLLGARDRFTAIKDKLHCDGSYKIVKKYYSEDEIISDSSLGVLYVDKEYDNIDYDFYDVPPNMNIDTLIKMLKSMEENKSDSEIRYLATALVNGFIQVRPGDYAILENEANNGSYYLYNTDNKWELASQYSSKQDTVVCMAANNNIELVNKMLDHDKDNKTESHVDMYQIQRNVMRFSKITNLNAYHKIKHNLVQNAIGHNYALEMADENLENVLSSPHNKLFHMIIGQADFIKKQNDLYKFTRNYTRNHIDDESPYWLYCNETGIKLIPSFLSDLSQTFVERYYLYNYMVEEIIKDRGVLSDDGNMWVDKHSGFIIKSIELDEDEGYTEDGHQNISHAVMPSDDVSDEVRAMLSSDTTNKLPQSEKAKMIINIINTMSGYVGVYLNDQYEYIIGTVTGIVTNLMPSIDQYTESMKKHEESGAKKPLMSFENLYNSTILFVTLSIFIITIQTAIPSIKITKTFPGCITSIYGYPLSGDEDLSAIGYVACIAHKIKSTAIPWNTLAKMKVDTIGNKLKAIIDIYGIGPKANSETSNKIHLKQQYLIDYKESEEIPKVYAVSNWVRFMPALIKYSKPSIMFDVDNISAKTSTNKLKAKTILLSYAIQSMISDIVTTKNMILTTSQNKPYVSNACCQDNKLNILSYFINDNNKIGKYNLVIDNMTKIMHKNKMNIPIYRGPSKNIKITSTDFGYSEDIVNKTINYYTNGNNTHDISMTNLLKIVGSKTSKHITPPLTITSTTQFQNIIKSETLPIDKKIRAGLLDILSSTQMYVTREDNLMSNMKNDLFEINIKMKTNLYSFLNQNGIQDKKITKLKEFIGQINQWKSASVETHYEANNVFDYNKTISDDFLYIVSNKIKTWVSSIGHVFPNMLLTKKEETKMSVPKHWGFSTTHNSTIITAHNKHYEILNPFYNNPDIADVLKDIIAYSKDVIKLSDVTPIHTLTKKETFIIDKRITLLLYEYYLLLIFTKYTTTPEYKETIAKLIVSFVKIMSTEKAKVDFSYDNIITKNQSIKTREKNIYIAELRNMTNDEKNMDVLMKKFKLGKWAEGKDVRQYTAKQFDANKKMMKMIESNGIINSSNVQQYMDDAEYDEKIDDEIEQDELGLSDSFDESDNFDSY